MALEDVTAEHRLAYLASLEGNVGFAEAISVMDQLGYGVKWVSLKNFLSNKEKAKGNEIRKGKKKGNSTFKRSLTQCARFITYQ
jgi:hypothetical protein